jgi:hypothetical protein
MLSGAAAGPVPGPIFRCHLHAAHGEPDADLPFLQCAARKYAVIGAFPPSRAGTPLAQSPICITGKGEGIMNRNDQIRRQLGFGQGTLTGKLREYYDPFERREETPAAHDDTDDIDFALFLRPETEE